MSNNSQLNNTYILNFLIGLHVIFGSVLFYLMVIDSTEIIKYNTIRYMFIIIFVTIILISKRLTIKKKIDNNISINSNTIKQKNLEIISLTLLIIFECINLSINEFTNNSISFLIIFSLGLPLIILQRKNILKKENNIN